MSSQPFEPFQPNIVPEQPKTAPVLELRKVTKSFPGKEGRQFVLQDFDLVVEDEAEGEFIAVLGPSGCGKSTIMSLVGGQSIPDSGEVLSFGTPVKGDNPYAVTVQQAYTCLPWRTVQQNVEFGLEIRGMNAQERKTVASEYIERVGLGDRANAFPKELSGGMQQRVAIARCLALKPRIMLMDEPFGALDAKIRSDMQALLLELWNAEKNSILFITHDITEALLLADRVIVVAGRPAEIVKDIRVPFARPRVGPGAPVGDLASTEPFLRLSHEILQLLKAQGGSGQVRVSL